MIKYATFALALSLSAISLSACTPSVAYRGYVPDPDAVAALRPGNDRKADVTSKLGTPGSVGTFDDSTWYYIGRREEQLGPGQPKITDVQILALHFDDNGVLARTDRYTAADGVHVEPVNRITPTPGRDLNAVQQVFSNIGRFNGAGTGKKTGGIPGAGVPGGI